MTEARVIHLLPGLCPGPATSAEAAADPAVARLGRWLGRARVLAPDAAVPQAFGWEAALAEALGFVQPDGGTRLWLAQPVQLQAGMKDLVAQPISNVTPVERDALWEAAQPELELADASLYESAHGLWLLELTTNDSWEGLPPSSGCGRPMPSVSLRGETLRRLQVLSNGLQMAWFQHPVNRQREAEGRAPVSGLWLWSPGRPERAPLMRQVCGGGVLARWLAETVGVGWSADPACAEAADVPTMVVVEALATAERRGQILESVAEDIVRPGLDRLRRGRVKALDFVDPQVERGARAWRLERVDSLAFWRSAWSL